MASSRTQRARALLLVACATLLTGCTATGTGSSSSSPPAPSVSGAAPDTAAPSDPFPPVDLSASNTCGQVSAYVSVISAALVEHEAGSLDESGYRARLDGAGELLGYLQSADQAISAALAQFSALDPGNGALDPTTDEYDAARRAVSDACEAAGSPIVLSASQAAGG